MTEYDITTKKFPSGNKKTKYNVNRRVTKLTSDPKYAKICQEIAKANQKTIRQGDLEKLTATFEIKE